MENKTCKKCKINKHVSEYFKDKNGKNGLKSQCKSCCVLINKNNPKTRETWIRGYRKRKGPKKVKIADKIPKDEFIRTCNEANNMHEASRLLGIKSFNTFRSKAIEYNCYKTNQGAKGSNKNIGFQKEVHEYKTRSGIRGRIIKDNLLPYKCQECGLEEYWNGKKIVLHLDHINGVNNDHKIENLRFLCPNCHSQTSTYTGRNSYK